jgi:hypothetical protein
LPNASFASMVVTALIQIDLRIFMINENCYQI